MNYNFCLFGKIEDRCKQALIKKRQELLELEPINNVIPKMIVDVSKWKVICMKLKSDSRCGQQRKIQSTISIPTIPLQYSSILSSLSLFLSPPFLIF